MRTNVALGAVFWLMYVYIGIKELSQHGPTYWVLASAVMLVVIPAVLMRIWLNSKGVPK